MLLDNIGGVRSLAKRIMPQSLVQFIRMSRYRGFTHQLRYSIAKPFYAKQFRTMNTGLRPSQIAIYPEYIFEVHEDAHEAFRYFADLDAETVEEMQTFLSLTKDRKCLLDVGAHYGIFSLVFANRKDAVSLAIDPSPPAYQMLQYHQEVNPSCKIISFPLALGNSEKSLSMHYAWTHLVASSESPINSEVVEVDQTTMDKFIHQQGIIPDTIKIDVEGFELNVLQGGHNFLRDYSPLIFLEIHPTLLQDLGSSVNAVVEFLTALGYHFYDGQRREILNPLKFMSKAIRRVVCSKLPISPKT